MTAYSFLNIPDTCLIGNTIYKKLFYENADFSTSDKSLFTNVIDKITWAYCLKPETINIAPFNDPGRVYPEIEVIQVDVDRDYRLERIAEIIMRTIPYPMLLIFKWGDKRKLYVAHQRTSQSDSSKNTIEEIVSTDWLDNDSALFTKLDIRGMRFTNFFTLYSDIVDTISIYKLTDIITDGTTITGAEARALSARLEDIEGQISSLRSRLNKESQFNRKMEMNIEIKELEQEKNKLMGGEKA